MRNRTLDDSCARWCSHAAYNRIVWLDFIFLFYANTLVMAKRRHHRRPCGPSRTPYRAKSGSIYCKRRYPKGAMLHTGANGGKYYLRKGRRVYALQHRRIALPTRRPRRRRPRRRRR